MVDFGPARSSPWQDRQPRSGSWAGTTRPALRRDARAMSMLRHRSTEPSDIQFSIPSDKRIA
jgi:hypothetical protein